MAQALDDSQPLASSLTITHEQDAAIRRLIARQSPDHHDDLLAALGLNHQPDQP